LPCQLGGGHLSLRSVYRNDIPKILERRRGSG
jgi:hypothetical protein